MERLETTTLSSRGQVVIPQIIREDLHLETGSKFIVVGKDDTVMLKKIEIPKFEKFDEIVKKGRKFAGKKKIKITLTTSAKIKGTIPL